MDNETKFTKGEWFIGFQETAVYSGSKVSGDGNILAKFDDFTFVTRPKSEAMANAHLIKTAPKLYAELERCREMLNAFYANTGSMGAKAQAMEVENLLAEARGEA